MKKTVTLRQAIDILAEQGIEVSWTRELTLQDFIFFYDRHYADGPKSDTLLQHMLDDIHDIFRTA